MKILFCITYYSPYISGLTLYVQRLAEALAGTYSTTVLCWKHDEKLAEKEMLHGVRIVRATPQIAISKGFLGWDFIKKSYEQVRHHDRVVVNLPQPDGIVPALFARFFGKRLIVIYHCEIDMKGKFVQWLMELLHHGILRLAHIVITYTEDYATHSRLLSRYARKIQTVYPPIPEQADYPARQKAIHKQIGNVDYVIGVAARLAPEKGFEYLFAAIPYLISLIPKRSFKIVIAGSLDPIGEADYKKTILALAEQYKAYLLFLGPVPPEEMRAFYSNLDTLVLPSINSTEAFGMVQVEAMMAGVPVVASDLPGVRVPIQETGMGRLVGVGDVAGLARAISQVLQETKRLSNRSGVARRVFDITGVVSYYKKLCS